MADSTIAPASPPTPPWFTSGGNNSRRGAFDRAVKLAPQPARTLRAQGAIQAAVVFDRHGRAFVADMAGGMQAFSGAGERLWQTRLTGGISATPALDPDGERIFVGTQAGRVYALETATGVAAWQQEIPTRSDARILSDLLFLPKAQAVVLSSWGGRFHRLAAATGLEQHAWDAGISPSAGAMADGAENLYCLRAAEQEGVQLVRLSPAGQETILHRQPAAKRPASRLLVAAPAVLDPDRHRIYFVTNEDRTATLHAWSVVQEKLAWSEPFTASIGAAPAVSPTGTIVVADMAGWIHVLAPDGTRNRRYATGAEYLLAGPVCDAAGTVFLGDPLGVLHVVPPLGAGQAGYEAPGGIQARAAFDGPGNLHVPATDRCVYVFANLAG